MTEDKGSASPKIRTLKLADGWRGTPTEVLEDVVFYQDDDEEEDAAWAESTAIHLANRNA